MRDDIVKAWEGSNLLTKRNENGDILIYFDFIEFLISGNKYDGFTIKEWDLLDNIEIPKREATELETYLLLSIRCFEREETIINENNL